MDDLIDTSETPATEHANVFSLRTGKPVADITEHTQEEPNLSVHERMINMDDHLNGMVERIIDEVGEDEFSEHTQLFLMIKKPGANTGLLWTTYAFRGVELIGALESAKLIAAERYFNGDD